MLGNERLRILEREVAEWEKDNLVGRRGRGKTTDNHDSKLLTVSKDAVTACSSCHPNPCHANCAPVSVTHVWPAPGEHMFTTWRANTTVVQYRKCIHPACSHVEYRPAPGTVPTSAK